MELLQVQKLSKSFGERKLFQDISFTIKQGKIYTVTGPNGSGKTTLLNIITGFIKADSGNIIFEGNLINEMSPSKRNKLGIARTFQDLRLVNHLSVFDNVLMAMEKKMFHIPTYEEFGKVENILVRISLFNFSKNMASDLSYGQQKLLTIGCCLANDPKLFLFDEPIAGIDDENRVKIRELILSLKNEGKTVLQVEHDNAYIARTSIDIFELNEGGLKTL